MSDAKPAEAKAAAPAGKPGVSGGERPPPDVPAPVHPYKKPEVYQRIAARFGGRVAVETDSLDGSATVKPEDLIEVARFCRDDPGVDCAMLHLISGVDYLADKKIQVVYHLESLTGHYMVVLKCDLPRDDPVVPSLVDLWPAADWQERETFDLMGVIFDGHPNLRRILCSEDWEGHPLRKDYVFPAYYHGIPNIFFEHLLTEEQKKLLYADMNEEQRRLLYGTGGESK